MKKLLIPLIATIVFLIGTTVSAQSIPAKYHGNWCAIGVTYDEGYTVKPLNGPFVRIEPKRTRSLHTEEMVMTVSGVKTVYEQGVEYTGVYFNEDPNVLWVISKQIYKQTSFTMIQVIEINTGKERIRIFVDRCN